MEEIRRHAGHRLIYALFPKAQFPPESSAIRNIWERRTGIPPNELLHAVPFRIVAVRPLQRPGVEESRSLFISICACP